MSVFTRENNVKKTHGVSAIPPDSPCILFSIIITSSFKTVIDYFNHKFITRLLLYR
jgi:hypothetical protein